MSARKTRWGLLLPLLLALSGCSSLRVPRIDPSGDRIFLPASQTPQSANGNLFRNCDFSGWTPQFKRPDQPLPESVLTGPANGLPLDRPPQQGPCGPTTPADKRCFDGARIGGGAGVVARDRVRHHLQKNGCETVIPRGIPGSVCLAPQTLVAPVGREVVLVSGMCGGDGYLLTDQPMEWMLSKESVGHFIDVGEPAPGYFRRRVQCREGHKLGVDYALTKTTKKQQMITRGTPTTKDDILLQRGQTWVSLTSPSEGTSYVTTLATDGDRWDQRRRTATIHWVDADVSFPTSRQLEAGQLAELTTTVVRSSDRIAAEGWIVRYRIEDGVSARFVPGPGQQQAQATDDGLTLETRTNADGEAKAFVQPTPGVTASSVPVSIEVIRPPRGASPRLPIATRNVNITWATASLRIECEPNRTLVEGGVGNFQFTVSNPGNLVARNVVTTIQLPDSFEFQNSTPAPDRQLGINYSFNLGDIEPSGARAIVIAARARAGVAGSGTELRLTATAVGEPNLQAKTLGCICEIVRPALGVTLQPMQNGPIEVNQLANYQVVVSNLSQQRLTNVIVTPEFPFQLQERQGLTSGTPRLVNANGVLDPNQTATFNVAYQPNQPGQFTHYLRVTSDQGHSAEAQQTLEVVPAQVREPVVKVDVELRGPAEVVVGGSADYEFFVANSGDTAVTDVQVAARYPDSMVPTSATQGAVPVGEANELRWRIQRLEPNDRLVFRIRCQARQIDPRAGLKAIVFGSVGTAPVEESDEITTLIVAQPGAEGAVPAPPAASGNAPPAGPNAGANTLGVTLDAFEDPVKQGNRANYAITLENLLGQADQDIVVSVILPSTMSNPRFGIQGEPRAANNVFVLPTISAMRPRERLQPIQFSAVANQPGPITVRIEVESRNSSLIVRELTTTVVP